ncbi:MAG: TonB-dependent receptor [Saprospiraceae bacterium]
MKTNLLIVLLLCAFGAAAQTYSVTGTVIDETGAPLPGAYVILQYPWGEDAKLTATEADGSFNLKEVEKGGYKLKVSFVGYEDFLKEITITDKSVNVGTLAIQPSATQLAEVEIKDKLPMAKQLGDTTQYNADAFKVMKDANAEDLIGKMPTVTVQDGKVQAQGEDVKQVLVDGKPFFGNDPNAALKNLPAEVIQKIQIYDQQSDQSQFTGFDDGNSSKTINIITRGNMQAGQFGKIYAGYGYEDKYQAGGNMNFFNGDQRISVIGMANNVNIQNFSTDDLLGVVGSSGGRGGRGGSRGGGGRPGGGRSFGSSSVNDFLVNPAGGVATTQAFGINYSDQWGKKLAVTGSYFFNRSKSNSEEYLTQQYFDGEGLGQVYDETTFANSTNINHRANFRFEFTIDSFNSIIMRPSISLQYNKGNSSTVGLTTLDSTLNATSNAYLSDLAGVNFTSNLLWRHKFAKKGRTFSVNYSMGYSPKNGNSGLNSYTGYFTGTASSDTLNQQSRLDVNSWNMSANFNYTEPIGESSQLMFEYKASYQQEESDKETYDYSEATGGYDDLNSQLSNVFSNDYITQQPGLGYSYRKGRDLMIMARGSYQYARLMNDQTFPQTASTDQAFSSFLPFAMLRYDINGRQKNVRVFYRTNTQLPTVEQLQNVVDNSNPLQLKTGNIDLKQSYSHSLFMRYQATNTEKSTVFFAMLGGSLTNNYIANATFLANSGNPIFDSLNVQPGAQLTKPVNLDGYRNVRSFITYGIPIKPIKSNLNIDVNYNYSRTPGLVNELANFSNSHTIGTGLTLSSNISDKIDFTLSARPSYNKATNSLQAASNSEYLSLNSRLGLNWQVLEGFVLRTDLANQYFTGLANGFNQNYWLWNLGIGKKIFKNQRGELTLSVNDLLNQNRNINRNVTETYIEDTRTNALTRYVMLTFTYNLRNFNSGKPKTQPEPDKEGRPPFERY